MVSYIGYRFTSLQAFSVISPFYCRHAWSNTGNPSSETLCLRFLVPLAKNTAPWWILLTGRAYGTVRQIIWTKYSGTNLISSCWDANLFLSAQSYVLVAFQLFRIRFCLADISTCAVIAYMMFTKRHGSWAADKLIWRLGAGNVALISRFYAYRYIAAWNYIEFRDDLSELCYAIFFGASTLEYQYPLITAGKNTLRCNFKWWWSIDLLLLRC